MTENHKLCRKCNKILPMCDFHKCKTSKSGAQSKCKICAKIAKAEWAIKNQDRVRASNRSWTAKNPEKAYEKSKRWHEKNPKWQSLYAKERRKSDPLFGMAGRARCRIRNFLTSKGFTKSKTTEEIIGCSFGFLVSHIESMFSEGMSWENRGCWRMDHIIPLSSASSEEEILALCHYTNLQPLWAYENKSKGCRILSKGIL